MFAADDVAILTIAFSPRKKGMGPVASVPNRTLERPVP
jgi:hypothetical protein